MSSGANRQQLNAGGEDLGPGACGRHHWLRVDWGFAANESATCSSPSQRERNKRPKREHSSLTSQPRAAQKPIRPNQDEIGVRIAPTERSNPARNLRRMALTEPDRASQPARRSPKVTKTHNSQDRSRDMKKARDLPSSRALHPTTATQAAIDQPASAAPSSSTPIIPTIRSRSSTVANSIVILPLFRPMSTFTRVSNRSDNRSARSLSAGA